MAAVTYENPASRVSAKSLIVDLISTVTGPYSVGVGALVSAGALFGLGENSMRVALARLLLSPAGDSRNSGITGGFLLLDEPTNHLDAQAKEWLAGWLRAYSGTVLLVSHDEALLDKGVDRLVEVRGSRLHGYSGNYARCFSRQTLRASAPFWFLWRPF